MLPEEGRWGGDNWVKQRRQAESTHVPTAVHVNRLPGDVAIPGEHEHRLGRLFHRAETPDRDQVRSGVGVARDHLSPKDVPVRRREVYEAIKKAEQQQSD